MKIENKTIIKILIIMIMSIAMLLILPKSVNASYKTITGKVVNEDHKAANFFGETLQSYSDTNLFPKASATYDDNHKKINDDTYSQWIGTDMGNFSINWNKKTSTSQFAASCLRRRVGFRWR